MNARVSRLVPPVVWALVIEVATSWPNPPVPGGLPEHSDKVVHLVMYGVFGALITRSVGSDGWRSRVFARGLMVVAAISCFGALDEWHQQFIPGRSMELGDWIADTTGALLGFLFSTFMAGVVLRRRDSRS